METKTSKNENIIFRCEDCDYTCSHKHHLESHFKSRKHLGNKNEEKNSSKKYICYDCHYICCSKYNLERHFTTAKHIGNKTSKNSSKNCKYICDCGIEFNTRSGLWKHKKECNQNNNSNSNNSNSESINIINELIKTNNEWQTIVKEIIKTGITNNSQMNHSHNTTTNSHNKTFNLQLYLNETCKNAMNLSEFIESIVPTLEELEKTGRDGYVKGISNIVITRLDEIETTDKPIHCSDGKREVLYVKENNTWNKEDEEKPLLTNAIKQVAHKNMCNISEWTKLNPDCVDYESKKNDIYLQIVSNSMSGDTHEESKTNYDKIISNVAKKTIIDKIV
jgi:hypothetical protein